MLIRWRKIGGLRTDGRTRYSRSRKHFFEFGAFYIKIIPSTIKEIASKSLKWHWIVAKHPMVNFFTQSSFILYLYLSTSWSFHFFIVSTIWSFFPLFTMPRRSPNRKPGRERDWMSCIRLGISSRALAFAKHKSSHKLRDCTAGLKDRGWSNGCCQNWVKLSALHCTRAPSPEVWSDQNLPLIKSQIWQSQTKAWFWAINIFLVFKFLVL